MVDTVAVSPPAPEGVPVAAPPRRFWPHALGLLVILVAIVPIVGTDSAFVTDESFVVIQLDTIEETGQWLLPHPVPEVDPEGAAFPLHGAARYEDGYTLYGKHPLLIYLYLPVHRAFGLVGLMALSVVGTWAAALVAARLAERIRLGSGVVALWLVGVGSPLFFDSYVIHAHTLAAAAAGLAAICALRILDDERPGWAVAALAATLGVALLRTEGVLFAGALGGAVGLFGLLRRRVLVVALGGATVAMGRVAMLLDREWAATVADSPFVAIEPFREQAASFVSTRSTSFSFTWLMPGYRGGSVPELLTFLGAALLVVGTVVLRRRPDDEGAVILPIAGAGVLIVRAFLEWGPVPGLMVAFCIGLAGLCLTRGEVARSTTTRFLCLSSAVFAVAVILTQYGVGGHTEWGGRYFALMVPLLGAVAAAALHHAQSSWPTRPARAVGMSLAVAALALGVLAVSTLRSAHDRNRQRSDAVLAAAAELPGDGPPVVVTEDDQIPRLARGRYEEASFLRVPPSRIDRYLGRLADEGVQDVLLVSVDPDDTLEEIPSEYTVVGPVLPHDLQYEGGGGLIRLHLDQP